MAVLDISTKTKLGAKGAKAAGKHPRLIARGAQLAVPAGKAGVKASTPLLKRRARKRSDDLADAGRSLAQSLADYAREAAYALGLAEPPKPKRKAPRLAAGAVVIGAAVYFLEPEHGREHRQKVAQLIG